MNTKLPFIIVLSFGLAAAIWAGAGVGDILGGTPGSGMQSDQAIDDASRDYNTSEGIEGQAQGNDDLLGMIISGVGDFANILSLAVLLPFELREMGFPGYFAFPIGWGIDLILWIGLFQIITGRIYE